MFDNKILKKLYLEKFHLEKKAKLVPFAGYMMPINYSKGIIFEHLNTRSNVGLFFRNFLTPRILDLGALSPPMTSKAIFMNYGNLLITLKNFTLIVQHSIYIIGSMPLMYCACLGTSF